MAHPSADQSSVGARGHSGEVLPTVHLRRTLGKCRIEPGIVELDGVRVDFTNVERARPERGPSAGLQPCLVADAVGHLVARFKAMRCHSELGGRGGRDLPIGGEESGRIVVLTVENQSFEQELFGFHHFLAKNDVL